jgi:phage-related baseplate assembly protein
MVGSIASSPSVDLSALPAPTLVAQPDFETRLAGKVARLVGVYPAFDALVESDPAYKLLLANSYDELNLAQAFNEVAKARLLAFAEGEDLDQLGALVDCPRLVVTPATGTAPAVMEGDAAYKRRIQLAPHQFSVAGPEQAYIYHALSASGSVADATATSPAPADIRALVLQVLAANGASEALTTAMTAALDAADWPGDVRVTVLAATASGIADAALLAAVDTALQGDVRPLTDRVIVQAAQRIDFAIVAEIYVFAGPDQTLILDTARASLAAHLTSIRKLGRDVARSAIIAALHVGNVQRVNLISPADDIPISDAQIGNPTSINVTLGGTER